MVSKQRVRWALAVCAVVWGVVLWGSLATAATPELKEGERLIVLRFLRRGTACERHEQGQGREQRTCQEPIRDCRS